MAEGADRSAETPPGALARLRRLLGGEGIGAVLVRGATGAAAANAAGALLAFLAQLVLARLLGVTQYGYYVYAFAWVMVLAQVSRLGFHASLIRFAAGYRTQRDWPRLLGIARRSAQLVFAVSVVAGILLAGTALALHARLAAGQVETFLLAAVLLVPLALLGVTQGLLQGYRRPARAILPFRTLVHGGTLAVALVAAATVGLHDAPRAMGITAAVGLASLAVAARWVWQAMRDDVAGAHPAHETRFWLRTSLPMLLMAGMQIVMKQTDTVMLGAMSGTDAAGIYFPLARMSELAAFGLLSVNAIVAPMIAELHTRDERHRLQRLLTLAAIGTSAVTVAAALAFWLLGEWVLGLFGPAFTAGYPALVVLLAGQVVNALCGPVGMVMTMTGHQDRASLVLVGGAALNVVLNAVLIPRYGLMGAATATAISVVFWNLWMLIEVVGRHRLNPSVFARWPSLRF